MISRFQWYRRMRGGYWAQVTAPFGLFSKTRWVRCKHAQPTPDGKWEFYPWAKKTMGNGYIDEWHSVEPCWAVPFSQWVSETIGTNDMACVIGLIKEARNAHAVWAAAHHPDRKEGTEALKRLRLALIPFVNAKLPVDE